MASVNHFLSVGVMVYQRVQDVPYVRDDSWGSFKGSYGTVYRATRRSARPFVGQGDVYAIKEIQAVSAKDRLNVAREIKFLQQFRHENILALEEAFIIDIPGHRMLHTICLVTKPWAPVSLHHFIQDLANSSGHSTICSWFKPQGLDPWPSIVRQCLSGLEYLHSQQPNPIRHKDIKPHNILLFFDRSEKPEVRPIIIDFGISKEHIDGATTANTGTYEYKAPEQITNQDPTLASDIFSLGCCFALMEGVLSPWPGLQTVYNAAMGTGTCQFAHNANLVNSVLQDLHGVPPSVPDNTTLGYFRTRIRLLVRQMLEKEPTDRPSAALALNIVEGLDLSRPLERVALVEVDRSQGRWKEAESLEVQVLEKKRTLGSEHRDTLISMTNLASTYRNQGRWKEAEELEVQVMETSKRVLGLEHLDTLTSMANLASTYINQGQWKAAEELQVQVMETSKRVLGLEHPDTLTSMANLASTFWMQGRWEEAKELDVQVMETRNRVLGSEHPSTLTSIANLASTYRDQGQWEEAEKLDVQVMETRKRVLGLEHPDTLTSMANIALTYRSQGRWEEAEKLEVQVMEISKVKLGADHPSTLTSMANLASTYRNQGRWEEAEKLEVQVMETRNVKLGADHPSTLTSIANLALTLWNQGRLEEAEKFFVQVVGTSKVKLGDDHPSTLTSMANLALTYRNQGRWEEAEKLDVQVMETRKVKLGDDHPDTLTSMNNLAWTWKSRGRLADALALMRSCVHARQRILGLEHPDTLSSLDALDQWSGG